MLAAPELQPAQQNRLLVIDDEPEIRRFVTTVARKIGFDVRETGDPSAFAREVELFAPTIVVMDLHMPQADGIELLRMLAERKCDAAVLLVSGADTRIMNTARRLGSTHGLNMLGALQKPVMLQDLEAQLRQAVRCVEPVSCSDLARAISSEELRVHFQPKIARSGRGWRVEGFEALVRWVHPDWGMLGPSAFIGIAEESELIRPLTDYVLAETIEYLAAWQTARPELSVAVNVGARVLNDLSFPDALSRLLEARGVKHPQLMLEITETAAMKDPQTTMDILARLRLKNIGIAIDDFGTGFSSLQQLYLMPFSELKIDASFVKDIPSSDEARTIVKAIVQLAHNLNMQVCAEGVEAIEAVEFLDRVGCDKLQGFLISPPAPATELAEFMERWPEIASVCGLRLG